MIADDFQNAFKECDVIAGPVAPTVAWKLGEKSDDPVANYLADIFTLPGSLAGLPGMSIPVGFAKSEADKGLPIGMQLIGQLPRRSAAARTQPTASSKPPTYHLAKPRRILNMSETVNTFEAQQQGRPTGPLVHGYEVIIGFETHAQLSTQSKIFSRASTAFGAEPNTQACAVDLALPGTLPVMNKGAVERAIQFGLAIGSHIAPRSIFARKNYFYPDLPKGYQISQFEIPVVQGGSRGVFLG